MVEKMCTTRKKRILTTHTVLRDKALILKWKKKKFHLIKKRNVFRKKKDYLNEFIFFFKKNTTIQ